MLHYGHVHFVIQKVNCRSKKNKLFLLQVQNLQWIHLEEPELGEFLEAAHGLHPDQEASTVPCQCRTVVRKRRKIWSGRFHNTSYQPDLPRFHR